MKTFFSACRPHLLLASLLVGPFCLSASTQNQTRPLPPEAYKLISVSMTGSRRFTSEQVAAASGLPVGTIAHEEDFKKAARQLGESGAFSAIAFTYSYTSAGTRLEFQVTDADKFIPARFADFVWFTDDELRQKVHERVALFHGELPASGRLADQVSDVLQALLVENGIPGHVEYLRHADKTGESVEYNVSGVSIRIHHADFPGARAAELPLLETAGERLVDREYSREYMANFVEHTLLPIYYENGYLKASCAPAQPGVVKPASFELDLNQRPRTYVDVTFAVNPGIQYKLAKWQWLDNKAFSTETLQPMIRAKPGQPANTVQLQDDLRSIQELYGTRGYIAATIQANAQFDNSAGTVAYLLEVKEGPVYHMGELEFRGLDNSLEARLRAAWTLRPGDVYDSSYLRQYLPLAQRLLPARLDWEVTTHVTALAHNQTVDVDLQYVAKAPR